MSEHAQLPAFKALKKGESARQTDAFLRIPAKLGAQTYAIFILAMLFFNAQDLTRDEGQEHSAEAE